MANFLRPAAIPTEIYTGKGEDDDTMLEHLEGYEDATIEESEGAEAGPLTMEVPFHWSDARSFGNLGEGHWWIKF